MASITSVISFFILLLATASFSAPVERQPESSTSDLEYSSTQPIVDHTSDYQTRLGSGRQSSSVPTGYKNRSSEEKDSDEVTTDSASRSPRGFEEEQSGEVTTEDASRSPRGFEESNTDEMTTEDASRSPRGFQENNTEEMTTEDASRSPRGFEENNTDEMTTEDASRSPRGFEENNTEEMTTEDASRSPREYEDGSYSSSTERNDQRTAEDFLYTTLESSTEFNQRAIRPVQSQQYIESSTVFSSDKDMKMTTDAEPSSSGQSFGKFTGLLNDESTERSDEESSPRSPVKNQRLTKTVSIIPGKITETKIYSNLPSKTSVVIQPVQQEQLSEVQHQSNIEKTKSDN